MNRRRFLIAGGGLAAVGAATVMAPWERGGADEPEVTTASDPASGPATATVTRGDLSTEREFKASVTFGDAWALASAASGTITWRRDAGDIVEFGEELIRVDDRPLFLAAGAMPLFRELRRVDTHGRDENGQRLTLQNGFDVAQLQAHLIGAGYDADGTMEADGVFGKTTETAVKAWQKDVGLPVSGRVDSAQLVFSDQRLRIAKTVRVGDAFSAIEVTEAAATVVVDTSNRDRGALPVGAVVDIDLPDGPSVSGTVTKQEQATGADGSRIWRTSVTAAGDLPAEASSATVRVLDVVAASVMVVPTSALLALAEGGFAVEIVDDADQTKLVRVDVGEVLGGRAEVSGELVEGDTVVVPS